MSSLEQRKNRSERRKKENSKQRVQRLREYVRNLRISVSVCEEKKCQYEVWRDAGDASKNLHLIPYSIQLTEIKKRRLERAIEKAQRKITTLES